MMITIIIVMIMNCWLRRTGATTCRWLLLLLLLCFTLFFSAVVFELWYESVSAMYASPFHIHHPSPSYVKTFDLTPISALSRPAVKHSPAALWISEYQNLGEMGLREGGGLRNPFSSWTSIESVHSSCSRPGACRFVVLLQISLLAVKRHFL